MVAENRDLLHKIGVTGGSVQKRIANAKLDPTFLMADVEIVTTYELYNINRVKLENLLHRIFEAARLDIQIKDRFGHPVAPREWFLVPLFAVDEAVDRIRDGSIKGASYDPSTASLKKKISKKRLMTSHLGVSLGVSIQKIVNILLYINQLGRKYGSVWAPFFTIKS